MDGGTEDNPDIVLVRGWAPASCQVLSIPLLETRKMIRRTLATTAVLLTCSPLFAQVVPQIPQPITDARNAFLDAHANTGFSEIGTLVERVWGRAFSTGATPTASVQSFVDAHAGIWGVTPAQLVPVGPFETGQHTVELLYDESTDAHVFTGVYYSQQIAGIPVFRAHLAGLVRNEPGFPMVLASSSLRDVSSLEAELTKHAPTMPSASAYTRHALNEFRSPPTVSEPVFVIWAGIDEQTPAPRLAVMFTAKGPAPLSPIGRMNMLYLVDAADGSVLYSESLIYHADVTGTVTGKATQGFGAEMCAGEVATGLPYVELTSSAGTHTTDVNGNFTIPWPNPTSLAVTSTIDGTYFFCASATGGDLSLTTDIPSGGSTTFVHNDANNIEDQRAQVNAYLHANIVRDYVLSAAPSYPTISTQSDFPVNVNLNSTCNAFYEASTINFYHSGGGCPNTAFSTIVYHEFGHNVVAKGGSGQGPYGEGMSDCISIIVSDMSELALGFFGDCFVPLRNADNNCQYQTPGCSSCGSANHACGQLLGGCIWDVRLNLQAKYPATYRQILKGLVVNSVPLHVGTSSITPAITVDFLTLNDDNADISDGTPDYEEINAAFSLHNMPGPAVLPIKFTFPNGLPALAFPNGGPTVAVNVAPLAGSPVPNTGKLFYRFGNAGAFTQVAMTQGAPNEYTVALPAGACGSTLQMYFGAEATGSGLVTTPGSAPAAIYSVPVAYTQSVVFSDDFETNTGWTYSTAGDTASSGLWTRNDPNGTAAQPENDHTAGAGTMCAFTGQGSPGGTLGEADVDNGITTLTSPVVDGSGADDLWVSAWVWYSNDKGANPNSDTLPVQVSNNGGTSWTTLQTISASTTSWVQYSWKLDDFVPLTSNMKIRFRAQDADPQSLVEVAVDDVVFTGFGCTAVLAGDVNNDGAVNGADITVVLGNWGGTGSGDANGDGTVDGSDITVILGNWTG